jgi:hypothetical protein
MKFATKSQDSTSESCFFGKRYDVAMNRFSLTAALLFVLLSVPVNAKAQTWDFTGEWKISLVKRYPPELEVRYPVKLSIRMEQGKLTAYYTDQLGESEECASFIVRQNEILFTTGSAGKKNIEFFGPVHRAILKNGRLRGFVFSDHKLFEWVGRRVRK